MSDAQTQAWQALIQIGERLSFGWTIVGGQLVHLHCVERASSPSRPTNDGDAALDVRAHPDMLMRFTTVLKELGFTASVPSAFGVQHRWTKDKAEVDVLIPRNLGPRAESRKGASGSPTIAAPGAQGALDRTEWVRVIVGDMAGAVPRPTLVGAIAAKAAALEIVNDPGWKRHVHDLVTLATLIRRMDDFGVLSTRDVQRVENAIGRTVLDPALSAAVDGGAEAIDRLRLALNRS